MKNWIIVTVTSAFILFMIVNFKVSRYIISEKDRIYQEEINNLELENFNQYLEIENLKNVVIDYGLTVTVTMYEPLAEQCDNTPHITADGSVFNIYEASKYKWVALSRDLIKRYNKHAPFKYGDLVYIKGIGKKSGLYFVKDTMNKRFKNAVDILETEGTEPYKFTDAKLAKVVWNI